ncbi:hypothetical protein J6590_106954, partial [Homalodisca vitripennis]
ARVRDPQVLYSLKTMLRLLVKQSRLCVQPTHMPVQYPVILYVLSPLTFSAPLRRHSDEPSGSCC